jgi:hypothetical protein
MTEHYPQRPGQTPFAIVCAVLLALPTVGMCALFTRLEAMNRATRGME